MIFKAKKRQGLRALDVGLVYLYGSRTGAKARSDSDFDLAVVFTRRPTPERIAEIHPRLYDLLSAEFPARKTGDVDIAYLQDASWDFQFQVVEEGRILFESESGLRADYEESVIKQYLDFRPIAAQFSAALMERLG
jgi:predicted nucleotidyltransferase